MQKSVNLTNKKSKDVDSQVKLYGSSIETISKRIRILQKNLAFVWGVSANLGTEQKFYKKMYFGRYGKIKKIISYCSQDKRTYRFFVTYEEELSAALAIIALNNYIIDDKKIRASYGTNKYCVQFLKKKQCGKQNCFYLHQYDKDNEINFNDDEQAVFNEKNKYSLQIIGQNWLKIQNSVTKQLQNNYDYFPTVMQTLEYIENSPLADLVKFYRLKTQNNQLSILNSQQTLNPQQSEVFHKQNKNEINQEQLENKFLEQIQAIDQIQAEQIASVMIVKQIKGKRKGQNNKSFLNFGPNHPEIYNQQQIYRIKSIIQQHLSRNL